MTKEPVLVIYTAGIGAVNALLAVLFAFVTWDASQEVVVALAVNPVAAFGLALVTRGRVVPNETVALAVTEATAEGRAEAIADVRLLAEDDGTGRRPPGRTGRRGS